MKRRGGGAAGRVLAPTFLLWGLLLGGSGCGQRLQGGDFAGDATVRLQGTVGAPVGDAARAQVGALWLGYAAAVDPQSGIETTTLPVTSIHFPPTFIFDVLGPPTSFGHYATHAGRIIPANLRIARLILFDDQDGDGQLAIGADGDIAPPDRLLARADADLLLFVDTPPADPAALDGADALISNWEDASRGYHLLALDSSVAPPDFRGRVIDAGATSIVFVPPATPGAP